MLKKLIFTCCLTAAAALAQTQDWELGVIGGYSYSPSLTVKNASASAKTGFKNGETIGLVFGNDSYEHWSGEARYLYTFSDIKLSSGSTHVDFGAHTHIATVDFLGHFRGRSSSIRPFIAFGGGVKVLQGTGFESAGQPLGNLAALTATRQLQGVVDFGLGVKVNIKKYVRFRVEARDYISPSPDKVIQPAPGAKLTSAMNDIKGLAVLSLVW